jgi:hypothetical protein
MLLTKYDKKFTPQNFPLLSLMSLTPLININRKYHRKFSKKFETVLMGHSGTRGTLIYEKKLEAQNLVSDSL